MLMDFLANHILCACEEGFSSKLNISFISHSGENLFKMKTFSRPSKNFLLSPDKAALYPLDYILISLEFRRFGFLALL